MVATARRSGRTLATRTAGCSGFAGRTGITIFAFTASTAGITGLTILAWWSDGTFGTFFACWTDGTGGAFDGVNRTSIAVGAFRTGITRTTGRALRTYLTAFSSFTITSSAAWSDFRSGWSFGT